MADIAQLKALRELVEHLEFTPRMGDDELNYSILGSVNERAKEIINQIDVLIEDSELEVVLKAELERKFKCVLYDSQYLQKRLDSLRKNKDQIVRLLDTPTFTERLNAAGPEANVFELITGRANG